MKSFIPGTAFAFCLALLPACITANEPAPSETNKPAPTNTVPLFNGSNLRGWEVTDFAGQGGVDVKDESIIINSGVMLTGVRYTNDLPRKNYEISLEAKKLNGNDFFCGLTFPVKDDSATFIAGGWGGGVVGVSSIDDMDASENETARYMRFVKDQWYKIRLRVADDRIQAWIGDEQMVDQNIAGRKVSMRPGEIELSAPMGIATWQTTAAIRNIQLRKLDDPSGPANSTPKTGRAP